MIPAVSRGGRVRGLLRYLVGPGHDGERHAPHLVAGERVELWQGVRLGAWAADQIAKQFRKLIGAVKVADVTTDKDQLFHEMLLVKVGVTAKTRQEVVGLADLFKARIVDVSTTTLLLEATGEPDKLDKLLEVIRPFGIKEQARTGAVFISRGTKILNQRPGVASDRKYLAE